MIIDLLLQRIVDARSVTRLTAKLQHIKAAKGLKRNELRTTGTTDQICDSARAAVERGLIEISDVAEVVDELEENGGQHIFLFRCTTGADASNLEAKVAEAFHAKPADPTPAYYSEFPTTNRIYYEPLGHVGRAKQIGKTDFWVRDEDESHEDENVQVTVHRREEARIVNLLIVDPTENLVQVRIGQASYRAPAKQWEKDYKDFLERLDPTVDFGPLIPIPVWRGFRNQVLNRDETYMKVDEAHDMSSSQSIALLRHIGQDIREYPDYNLDDTKFSRDFLNIYWLLNDEKGNEIGVYTNQKKVEVGGHEVCKIWISRHLSKHVLDNVLARILNSIP